MSDQLSAKTRHRLDVQGFDGIPDQRLAAVAPWLRMAFALCAALAALGTITASSAVLGTLVVIAALAALFPVHPFDLIYNYGIRHLTGTKPLPRRGGPSRFACGVGAVWLLGVIWAFEADYALAGYVLGGLLTSVALLVATTDICIPSMIFRAIFGEETSAGEAWREMGN